MSVRFNAEFFSLYEKGDDESVTLFAEDLHKIIKSVSKLDNVFLETNENYLVCKLESRNGNSRIFEFVLPSEHIESPNPPSIDLPVICDLDLDDLKQSINDLKIIGSHEISFQTSPDALNITSGIEVTTNYISTIPILNSSDESVASRFSLEYLEQLLKFNKISKSGTFQLGNNYPLLYSFKDEIMGVEVNGMIAPRMELED
jgi:DNA polymerase III sliding clamp (beta) subunit (PCNA family)